MSNGISETTHIQDALKIALEREEKAVRFYTEGAGKVTDAGVKALFRELAQEEKGHASRIKEAMEREIMREM